MSPVTPVFPTCGELQFSVPLVWGLVVYQGSWPVDTVSAWLCAKPVDAIIATSWATIALVQCSSLPA